MIQLTFRQRVAGQPNPPLTPDESAMVDWMDDFRKGALSTLIDVSGSAPRTVLTFEEPVSWGSKPVQDQMARCGSFLWYCEDFPEDILWAWYALPERFLRQVGAPGLQPTGGILQL